jgi:hypothetical protein
MNSEYMRETATATCYAGDQSGAFDEMKQHNILKYKELHQLPSWQFQNIE